MKTYGLFTQHISDAIDVHGELLPCRDGWWVYSTDGLAIQEVDGPFPSDREAKKELARLRGEQKVLAID